jgi:hypothetical protein
MATASDADIRGAPAIEEPRRASPTLLGFNVHHDTASAFNILLFVICIGCAIGLVYDYFAWSETCASTSTDGEARSMSPKCLDSAFIRFGLNPNGGLTSPAFVIVELVLMMGAFASARNLYNLIAT